MAWRQIACFNPRLRLIAVSNRQRALAPDLPWLAVCPNGLDLSRYPFRDGGCDYLAFLGRMSPDKGCREAIEVAHRTVQQLRIAAKVEERHEREYFEREVEPHLGDGTEFVGELTHDEKVELLAGAQATLFPTDVEEAFGLVLVESMACGTPRGRVPATTPPT